MPRISLKSCGSDWGHSESIAQVAYPEFDPKYLVENEKEYPVSFNGKLRFKLTLPLDLSKDAIEEAVMNHDKTKQQLDGSSSEKSDHRTRKDHQHRALKHLKIH
jgi:leucyl-tRNA synthetase